MADLAGTYDRASLIPLPDLSSIRLVWLQASKSFDAPVICKLALSSLEAPHPYEALSYTCGPAISEIVLQDAQVSLDGMQHTVTGNLYAALRHLRYSEQPRCLWIDAISINQRDDVEKGRQVAMMHHIYAKASRVISWLGEECCASHGQICFAFLRLAFQWKDGFEGHSPSKTFSFYRQLLLSMDVSLRGRIAPKLDLFEYENIIDAWDLGQFSDQYIELATSESMHSVWLAMQCLLLRRYLSRRWMIQEILRARNVSVQLGHQIMPWQEFESACIGVLGSSFGQQPTAIDLHCRRVHRPLTSGNVALADVPLIGISNWYSSQGLNRLDGACQTGESQLFDLLGDCVKFQCSDERDIIYAIMGALHTPLSPPLEPDYTLSTAQTFIKLAQNLVNARHTMRLLWEAMHQNTDARSRADNSDWRLSGLPTWIPDWRHKTGSSGGPTFWNVYYRTPSDAEYLFTQPQVRADGRLVLRSVRIEYGQNGERYLHRLRPRDTSSRESNERFHVVCLQPIPRRSGRYAVDGLVDKKYLEYSLSRTRIQDICLA